MKKQAFKMHLLPGNEEEYKKRHTEIWPELKRLLKEAGIAEYSIWLDEETNTLFAVQDLPEGYDGAKLAADPIMKKWWNYMEDLMETNPDASPVVTELKEMFYLK